MKIQIRANETAIKWIIGSLSEDHGMHVLNEGATNQDKEGYALHFLEVKGTRKNPAYKAIISILSTYASNNIDHLTDARRMFARTNKK